MHATKKDKGGLRKRLTDRRIADLLFKLLTFLHFPLDIDDCQPNPCVHGTCTDGWNNYTCQCSPGYRGDNCDEGKKRIL